MMKNNIKWLGNYSLQQNKVKRLQSLFLKKNELYFRKISRGLRILVSTVRRESDNLNTMEVYKKIRPVENKIRKEINSVFWTINDTRKKEMILFGKY